VFNQDIGDWDVSNVTDMTSMFLSAINFANGYLSMCLPKKGGWRSGTNSQINVSPATYSGIALGATASATDTNLRFYSQKTSQIMQVVSLSSKINILTVSDYQNFVKVRFTTTGTLPTNLSVGTDYWLAGRRETNGLIPVYDNPQYRVATSYANAVAGTYINYVNAGTGTHTIIEQDSTDGWVLGAASTLYFNNGYDNAGTMTMPASGKWYTRWVYRELSAANKNVFYVSGTAIYDSSEEAEVETEPVSLPAHITSNCVLVGRIIQRWVGDNSSEGQCSVISRKLGPGSDGIGSWNVAKATSMSEMFHGAKMFDIPLSWNAASCTNFYRFLSDARNFNQSINGLQINPLGTLTGISMKEFLASSRNFNNGQVCYRTTGSAPIVVNLVGAGDCESMFSALFGFNQNLNALDMSTVTKLNTCFRYDDVFNNGGAIGTSTSPLLWSVGRSSTLSYMFSETDSFNQPLSTLLENFAGADLTFSATGGVATITRVGHGLANGNSIAIINSSDIALLPNGTYTIAGVTTNTFTITAGSGTGSGTAEIGVSCSYMFEKCPVFNQDISKWNVSKVTNMGAMLTVCPAFNNGADSDTNIVTGRSGLDGWDVGNVTNMGDMFNGATVFNRPLANWNVGKVTNMVSTFKQTAFNQDIGNWNTESVTSMNYMFNDCQFNQDIGNWNVSNCTGFQGMFSTVLVPSTFDQDLSKWDVGKCVDFQYMFRRCFAFNNGANTRVNPITGRSGIDGWNIGSNVATPSILMFNMFWSNTSNMGFNRNIGSWDMAKVTNISGMFRLCTSFNQDVSAWNTTQITNMSEAFYNCSALKQNFGAWNVSACTNLSNMFFGCNLNAPATSTNYDALLNGWASRPVVASRSFHGGTSKYGLGAVASRAVLTGAPNLWTIADGGAI
jgi:surface protein